jgi:arsenical-resistance protein 2
MAAETPWHAAYPAPRNKNPHSISREDLLQRLESGQKSGKDFLLVDLRRTDHEVSVRALPTSLRLILSS